MSQRPCSPRLRPAARSQRGAHLPAHGRPAQDSRAAPRHQAVQHFARRPAQRPPRRRGARRA
eukprot:2468119-Prymnesium_polylepis.1